MNESDIDPFLAVSDYSEDEKAIQDINAFLNAPSSVVVTKKSNNQIGQAKNPSSSTTNTQFTNEKPATSNNFSQPTSPKKGSIQLESSVFELPSFDSSDNNKSDSKETNSVKIMNDFSTPQKNRNENQLISNKQTSSKKKDAKKSSYTKPNLLSNQELFNAFFAIGDKTNNNDTKQEENKSSKEINQKLNKENDKKSSEAEINNIPKKESDEKKLKPEEDQKDKQKSSTPLDFLSKLDLDATEIGPDNEELKAIEQKAEKILSPSNSYRSISPKHTWPKFHYITPKSPIEAFEYSFMRYLEDASNDLRVTFAEEFQTIVEQKLDFQDNIHIFLTNLNQELRLIFEDEAASLDLKHSQLEYDTDYITSFFQSLSSSLKKTNLESHTENLKFAFNSPSIESNLQNLTAPNLFDFNNVPINSDLIQTLTTSFVTNSKSILSDLQKNLTELLDMQPDYKRSEEVLFQNIYKQRNQTRLDLEEQEQQLCIERNYIAQRFEKLKQKSNADFLKSENRSLPREFDDLSDKFYELTYDIDDIIHNLKNYDVKKAISPLTSFSKKVKLSTENILFLNTQLCGKVKIASRSLLLSNKNNFMPSVMQPSNMMKMQPPLFQTNYEISDFSYQAPISNDFNNYITLGNNKISNSVRERLANIKQTREDQIAEVHELISDNQ